MAIPRPLALALTFFPKGIIMGEQRLKRIPAVQGVSRMTVLDTYLGIAHESPEEKVLTLLIELGAQFVGALEGSLLVVDETSNELVFAMTVGRETSEKPLVGQRVPMGKGLVGLAAQTHEVQIGAPTFHLPQDQEKRHQAEAPRAEIAAPLLIDETLIGVITAVSFKEDKKFSSIDALLYARIAWVAAIVIDQRRRLAAFQALTDGKEVSGLLREDERLDLEIVAAVSRLVRARPERKAGIARFLSDILSFLES
jgi:transcriptional regulator with GAF, ATPase, and Fis domain